MNSYMNEYELLYLYRQNDEAATQVLFEQYHRLIWSIVFRFSGAMNHLGLGKDDLFQEGMIGLMEAIDCYRDDLLVPFKNFACLCAERQMRSLIRKYSGQNYSLIHQSVSLDQPLLNEENLVVMDTIACDDQSADPVWSFYYHQHVNQLKDKMKEFSVLEKRVMYYRSLGYTYTQIAEACDCNFKAVDNTLQKLKRKIIPLFD